MEFATEMVIKASVSGMRDHEVPITLRPDGRRGPRTYARGATAGGTCGSCCSTAPTGFFSIPGLVMVAVGLGVGGWLLPGPRRFFGAELDVHTLLYAGLAVLMGVQAVVFAISARMLAVAEGLRPDDRLRRFHRSATLEAGLVVGGAAGRRRARRLAVGGVVLARSRFGPLSPSERCAR